MGEIAATGTERDAATAALVEYLTGVPDTAGLRYRRETAIPVSEQDREAAFAWAASMSGEIERSRYMTRAAQLWALDDAAAARAAVETASLPEADKQSLLRQLPQAVSR